MIRGFGVVDPLASETLVLCHVFDVDGGVTIPMFEGPYFGTASYLASTTVILEGRWRLIVYHHHPQFHASADDGVQFLAFRLGNNGRMFVNCEDNDAPLYKEAITL